MTRDMPVRLSRRAMGTTFEVVVRGDRAAAEEALAEIDRLEDQLSIFLPTSEISRINAAPGPVKVEPRLMGLLRRMRELHEKTGGAFDGGISAARFDETGSSVQADDLDLGGIGKGYAIDRAVQLLKERGIEEALVHGGTSTVHAMGEWRVGLVDPRDPGRRFGTLTLRDQALSTSSNLGGKPGHIPRGRHVCAWAVCDNATDADAYSTAFLIAGVQDHPGVGAMVLGEKLEYRNLRPELTASAEASQPRTSLSRRDFMRGTAAVIAAGMMPRRAAAQAKPLSVAVIGVGEQGRLLLAQLARMKDVEVPAVCDTREEARKKGIEIAGREVETYEDAAYLLEEESLDAVVIATPTHTHRKIALLALERDVPVFCEAPLARTIDDCKAIAKAARKKLLQVGHQRRCSRLYPHIHKHAKSGALGKLLQVRAQWNRKLSWKATPWRIRRETSGGLLLECGSHIFDLASWYFDALPEAVCGMGEIASWKDGRDVDDTVQVVLRYPGGRLVDFGASLAGSFGDETEVIAGDGATAFVRRQSKGLLFKEADTALIGWEEYASKEMLDGRRGIILDPMATKYKDKDEGERIGPDADKADYHAELEQFLASVRGGEAPRCGAREGLVAAVTALVAEQAVRSGRTLEFTREHFEV